MNGSDMNDSDMNGSDMNGSDMYGYDQYGSDMNGSDMYGSDQYDSNGPQFTRDHEYLYLESVLYFDVIQKDEYLPGNLQEVIDGDMTLDDFNSMLTVQML